MEKQKKKIMLIENNYKSGGGKTPLKVKSINGYRVVIGKDKNFGWFDFARDRAEANRIKERALLFFGNKQLKGFLIKTKLKVCDNCHSLCEYEEKYCLRCDSYRYKNGNI